MIVQRDPLYPQRLSTDRIKRLHTLAEQLGEQVGLQEEPFIDTKLLSPRLKYAWMREWPEMAEHSDLSLATLLQDQMLVESILAAGGDPNSGTDDGMTPLIYASQWGNARVLNALLSAGADPNAKTSRRETALLFAAQRGDVGIASALIQANADVRITREDGLTILMAGASSGNADIVKLVLKTGGDAKRRGPEGWTPLMFVAGRQAAEIAHLLIANGADVQTAGTDGTSALMIAATKRSPSLIRLLLNYGAQADLQRFDGKTALHLASEDDEESSPGDLESVRLLLAAGANPNMTDNSGGTPLMNAAHYGNPTIVQALVLAGAKIDARNTEGKTAIEIAIEAGNAK
ncbi:MAG: hypothetical protein NVS9B5_37490 [Terriglobales bacterium]